MSCLCRCVKVVSRLFLQLFECAAIYVYVSMWFLDCLCDCLNCCLFRCINVVSGLAQVWHELKYWTISATLESGSKIVAFAESLYDVLYDVMESYNLCAWCVRAIYDAFYSIASIAKYSTGIGTLSSLIVLSSVAFFLFVVCFFLVFSYKS